MRLWGAGFLAALSVNCQRAENAATGTAAAASASAQVFGVDPREDVPVECRAYADKVLRCMKDPHYPKELLEAQASALKQMMEILGLKGVAPADRRETFRNASQQCGAALDALRDSGQSSCPDVF